MPGLFGDEVMVGTAPFCAAREVGAALLSRLDGRSRAAVERVTRVEVTAFARATWTQEDECLSAAVGDATLTVPLPEGEGRVLECNPLHFTVVASRQGEEVCVLVAGLTCAIQEGLPW